MLCCFAETSCHVFVCMCFSLKSPSHMASQGPLLPLVAQRISHSDAALRSLLELLPSSPLPSTACHTRPGGNRSSNVGPTRLHPKIGGPQNLRQNMPELCVNMRKVCAKLEQICDFAPKKQYLRDMHKCAENIRSTYSLPLWGINSERTFFLSDQIANEKRNVTHCFEKSFRNHPSFF